MLFPENVENENFCIMNVDFLYGIILFVNALNMRT